MKLPHLFLLISICGLTACQTTQTPAPDRFARADSNGNGQLTAGEASDYIVTTVFESLDTDQNNQLTQKEWDPTKAPATVKSFRERDANRDGVVTLEEAKVFGRKSGRVNDLIKDGDTNGDGVLSRKEVEAYYASKEG